MGVRYIGNCQHPMKIISGAITSDGRAMRKIAMLRLPAARARVSAYLHLTGGRGSGCL